MHQTTNIIAFNESKKYLVNFLKVILKKEKKNDIIIANSFGEYLKVLLSKPPQEYIPETRSLKENEIRIEIPFWQDLNTSYNYYLNKNSRKMIEDWLDNIFKMVFDIHMESLTGIVQFKTAIENFMVTYNISAEFYEMLKKRNYRKRRKMIPDNSNKIGKITSKIKSDLSHRVSF